MLCEERLLSLIQLSKMMPAVNGRPSAVSTLWRWCRKGIKSVRLEYVRIGRTIATSEEALARFFAALAAADTPVEDAPPIIKRRPATPAARKRAIDAAMRRLEKAGI